MPNSFPQAPIQLPGMTGFYRGKVRDVYFLEDGRLVMVASDRISAFDVVTVSYTHLTLPTNREV